MNIKTQRYLKIGLSCLNIAGVVGTFIFASKDAVNYQKVKESLPKDAKKKTKVKSFIKSHWRSLIFAGATIASGVGSTLVSNKVEASLMATVSMLDASTRKYRKKIKETLGIDADKSIIEGIMKDEYEKPKTDAKEGEALIYEEHIGYFYAKPENIWKAYTIMVNDIMAFPNSYNLTNDDIPNCFTLGEFLKVAKGRPLSHTLTNAKLNFGWGYQFLKTHFGKEVPTMDFAENENEDGVRLLYFVEDPVWNPTDWEDYMYGAISEEEYFSGSEEIDIPNINSQYYQKMNNNIL